MTVSYWKNKNVLVTGADGFIGSHLVEALATLGANVRAYVFYNSFDKRGWLDYTKPSLQEKITFFSGDIRDANRVKQAAADQEIIFHLASLIAIPYSYDAPESYLDTNCKGALHVLNAARESGVKRVIHTSTSEVYGTAQYTPIDEKHPLQGQSPYSASKIGADMLAESYYRSFGVPVTTLRPFNTFGPRQSARAVIPTILSQLLSGSKMVKIGSLTPVRDFNFVSDTVDAFIALAQSENGLGEVFNCGSGREVSIGDLFRLCCDITGKSAEPVCESERVRPEKSEVNRLICNFKKIEKLTSWKPKHTLQEGLIKTAEWIQQNQEHFRIGKYTV